MKLNFNLKKIRFIVLSVLLIGFVYFLATRYLLSGEGAVDNLALAKYTLFIGISTILSSLFVQYLEGGDRSIKTVSFVGLTPFLLVMGVFLFFIYYPNLSVFLKVGAGFFYTVLLYTLLLLNNVLLVVGSREGSIPVYRVAINWVQIVLLGVSITLFTGILRVQVQPLIQVLFIIAVSLLYYSYLIWVYSNEKDIRRIEAYGAVILVGSFALLVGWGTFVTLFFPAESFLRGIFISSVFLLGLGYIQLYLKNSLSKKSIWDYLLICLVFFSILVLFKF